MSPVAEGNDRAARWDELIAAERCVEAALAHKFGSVPSEERAQMIRDAEIELMNGWQCGETAWPDDVACWLVECAGHDACDRHRQTKRRATEPAGVAGADFEAGAAPGIDAELERIFAEENARGLYALLSPQQRNIAALRYSADLEPKQIAKLLKLS